MNLFCFTLDGSTDSIYEPPHNQSIQEVIPKCQCSPVLLRHTPEWGGSDPCINPDLSPTPTSTLKRKNRRSHTPTSALDNETLDTKSNHACWMPSSQKQDSAHQKNNQDKEMYKAPCQRSTLTRDDKMEELNSEKREKDLPTQSTVTEAGTDESLGRLKRFQRLVQVKKGSQSGARKGKNIPENNERSADTVWSDDSPVITCIGLSKKEKKSCKTASSPQQQQTEEVNDREEEGVWSPGAHSHQWSPSDCPQPWTPSFHICHQPRHELWDHGFDFILPQTTEWDRFESLAQELDTKQCELSPLQVIYSNTDLESTRLPGFGRFDAFECHSPQMKQQDDGSSLEKQVDLGDPTDWSDSGNKMKAISHTMCQRTGRKHVTAPPKELSEETEKDNLDKREVNSGQPFVKGHKQSSNSLESLYSLNSGQSSSSGVTSGSDCSSNRGSLRLEEDLPNTRQFCGRARVHTDFVPSPYDTESLQLKVGDVIDIIAKPPMGIWTGMLNNKIGNFKFIYVDVLVDKQPETHNKMQRHGRTQKTRPKTLQEFLKPLSLEDYSSSLRLSGYQSVDDLMGLRERQESLLEPQPDSQCENEANQEPENVKADTNNCPRDSGCHMLSDCSDNSKEDTEIHY